MVTIRRLLLLSLALAVVVFAWGFSLLHTPFGPTTETFVDIPGSTTSSAMATQLADAGIIRSRGAFLFLRLTHPGSLRAGEYRFDHPIPLTEVYKRLRRGDIYTRTLVVPEGFNIFDIAGAVQNTGLGNRAIFLAAARRHVELIADLAPHAPSLEGFLFPATYRFPRHTTPEQILATMIRRFRQTLPELKAGPGSNTDLLRTVTMASLIEKEVGVSAERPLVAGVFRNRLARDMPLQTDPSVIYAALLEGRYRGTIYRSDLDSPSPYNTYRHRGLPPGPICNPGMAALQAALHPTPTGFLYFVSDAAGHTRFSVDLHQHQAQVEAYRSATPARP